MATQTIGPTEPVKTETDPYCVTCPHCEAEPGMRCHDEELRHKRVPHHRRIAAAAKLHAPKPPPSTSRQSPARDDVRLVACPTCHAAPGSPCDRSDVAPYLRHKNHAARILAYHESHRGGA